MKLVRPSRHQLRAALLLWLCAMFAGPAVSPATAAKAPRVIVTPTAGEPGTTFKIRYERGTAKGCRLSVFQSWSGGKRVLSTSIRRRKPHAFAVKAAGKLGTRQAEIRCGKRSGRAYFEVVAPVSKLPEPVAAVDDDPYRPFDVTDEELAALPLPQGIGGDGRVGER